jgi:hypothetical protein
MNQEFSPDEKIRQLEAELADVVSSRDAHLANARASRERAEKLESDLAAARDEFAKWRKWILDDVLVFLASYQYPTPEQGYEKDGGWGLALSDLQGFVRELNKERDAARKESENTLQLLIEERKMRAADNLDSIQREKRLRDERDAAQQKLAQAQKSIEIHIDIFRRVNRVKREYRKERDAARKELQECQSMYRFMLNVPRAEDAIKLIRGYQEEWELWDLFKQANKAKRAARKDAGELAKALRDLVEIVSRGNYAERTEFYTSRVAESDLAQADSVIGSHGAKYLPQAEQGEQ